MRHRLLALPCAFVLLPCNAGDGATFDLELLRQRGLSEELASYFDTEPRFTPGRHSVTLQVNGARKGPAQARFLDDGSLCVDAELLDAAGLRLPTGASGESPDACIDLSSSYPQSQIEADPRTATLTLVLPSHALAPTAPGADLSAYDSGGFAAMFNYDVSMLDTRFKNGGGRAWTALTEAGFNLGDWVVRSRQIASLGQQASRFDTLEAYAQRTFAERAAVLQVGQVHLGNPVLSGVSVDGVQLLPEQALGHLQQRRVVEGIAKTQARVEIYQRNRLVYATVVPPGPFSIDNTASVDAFAELQMTIHEADGEQRRIILPAPPADARMSGGYQFGIGQLRHSSAASPWVLSTGWSGAVREDLTFAGGLLAADGYLATGFALGAQPWPEAEVRGALGYSQPLRGDAGSQIQISLGQQIAQGWGASLAYVLQSRNHRDLQQALEPSDRVGGLRNTISAGLSWQGSGLGSFSVGGSQSRSRSGRTSNQANLRWAATLAQVSLNAGVEWSLKGADHGGRLFYLSASMPVGAKRRLSTSTRASAGNYRTSFTLREQASESLAYRVGGSHQSNDSALRPNVGATWLAPFTQVQLDYSRTGESARTLAGNLRGGAVAHAQGITLSPYPIQDTFALIEVGDLHGVKVDTPSGPVWTDQDGRAVAARILPYTDNRLQVQTRSLPRNAELANSLGIVRAGRGAISRLDFLVQRTRRVLLELVHEGTTRLPEASMVIDGSGSFVTMVQAGGLIFLHDFQETERYHVASPDGSGCVLEFRVTDTPDPEEYYETTTARCRAS